MQKSNEAHAMKWKKLEEKILSSVHNGEMLPPERKLCQDLSVSRTTLRKTLQFLTTQGKIHKLQGRGSFVISKKKSSSPAISFPTARAAICIPSFIAPFLAKTFSGWDDHMPSGYITHGFIQPYQQLDILRVLNGKVEVLALDFLPWTRKVLSPMPILENFQGKVIFLLDRHCAYTDLGFAVVNDEQTGIRLAMDHVSGQIDKGSMLYYFHRRSVPYQSNSVRLELVPKFAGEYGIRCETVNMTFRIRQKLRSMLSGKRKHIFALCSDSKLANDLITVCGELGIRYGDDLTVVSLFETGSTVKVPHVAVDSYSIGQKAAELTLDLLEGKEPEAKTIIIPPGFNIPKTA